MNCKTFRKLMCDVPSVYWTNSERGAVNTHMKACKKCFRFTERLAEYEASTLPASEVLLHIAHGFDEAVRFKELQRHDPEL